MKEEKIENLTILLEAFLSAPNEQRVSVNILAKSLLKSVLEPLKISLEEYGYHCGDGCCYNYGTKCIINGEELNDHSQGERAVLEKVLTHLGYKIEIEESCDFD